MKESQQEKYNEQQQSIECEKFIQENVNVVKGPKFGKRHIQIININLLIFVSYYSRTCMSVAIVAINDRNASSNPEIPTFNWDSKNLILSSFFMGYVPLQLILGCFLHKISIKALVLSGVSFQAILGILIPLVAIHVGDMGVVVVRVLIGVGQSFTFPVSYHLMSQWIPPTERSLLGGATLAVRPFATVAAMTISGYTAASEYGWPWIFYICGILTILSAISFAAFSYDKPANHPTIDLNERKYIERSISVRCQKVSSTPYKAILTSLPVWVMVVASVGNFWSFWTLQSQTPMYLNSVMKFNIAETGSLAALPYLLQWIFGYLFSLLSKYLINNQHLSVNNCRKLMNSIGFIIPAICLILLQNSGPSEATKAVVLINLAVGINGASFSGYMINMLDITVNYAGFLLSLSNTFSQSSGFLTPLFADAVVKNETDPNEWNIVFYTAAGLYIFTAILYDLFASGEIQPWDN